MAVVLPTVSLIWFMTRVVANERLVVHQKLAALYQDKLADANARTEALFARRLAGLDPAGLGANPYALFRRLILQDHFQGAVMRDLEGELVYPRSTVPLENDSAPNRILAEASQEEFAKARYAEAAQIYARYTSDADTNTAVAAILGTSRCLAKLGRVDEAIQECEKAAFIGSNLDPALRVSVENARLLLLSLVRQAGASASRERILKRTVQALVDDLYYPGGDRALLPPNQNLLAAQMVLQSMDDSNGLLRASQPGVDDLRRLADAEELSLGAAESLGPDASPFEGVVKVVLDGSPVYIVRHKTPEANLLLIVSPPGMSAFLAGYGEAFNGTEATYRILDATGDFVAGSARPRGSPFATAALPDAFPGWHAQLYFEGSDVFEKAARRQIAVYIWTGVLVIVLILMAGGFATRAVGKQIRLNTMKNDFMATVSHELKTPLASMRVLIDTLMEGNVRDEAQVTEYLRLTAKENERLSRMIDNFLTFSRMERNKVAFHFDECRPQAIAQAAAESVKTKFAAADCPLSVELVEPLPTIQADEDGLVTVLINLLDNACKYGADQNRVTLKVHTAKDEVCFAVSDNGIGLAKRHIRRIFERFYQVDSSLARKAEGCGLGLSIVKFIVDAHKGTISVESKPGKGSTFTVCMPCSGGQTHDQGHPS